MRLNLGCGVFYRDGWVNVDLNRSVRADLYEDVSLLPSVGANTATEIYAGHVCEHVHNVEETFGRWLDVLVPGGVLTVVVPDGPGSVRQWRAGGTWPGIECESERGILAVATGYQSRHEADADTGGFQAHRRVWDFSTLSACLKHAGFVNVRLPEPHPLMVRSDLDWQLVVAATK